MGFFSFDSVILILLMAVSVTFVAIYILQPVANRVGLLDIPDARKQHVGAIPLIGGLSIFVGLVVTLLLFTNLTSRQFTYIACSTAIVLLGALDDKYNLPFQLRLISQAAITLAMYLGSGLHIHDFGNLLGFGDIELGWFGVIVTLLAVLGAINAFNMLDGIDGLIGSSAMISFSALAILFFYSAHEQAFLLSLILIVTLIPFLISNLTIRPFKNKIFMGDAGSMLIGFSIIWLLMQGSQRNDIDSFRAVTALWIIAIPLMDMAAIMIRRVRKGQSPFKADRDHLHHIFMRAGYSSGQALIIITCLSIILASIGLIGEWLRIPEVVMFAGFMALFLAYNYALLHSWKIATWLHKRNSVK